MGAAADGDTVLVGPGRRELARPIVFGGKRVALRSERGREETTLRRNGGGHPVRSVIPRGRLGPSHDTVILPLTGKDATLEQNDTLE